MKITETADAKINLGLDVLGLRPDHFHEVAMVMQTVSLQDTVTMEPADSLTVTTDDPHLPGGPDNLAYRAAELLGEFANRKPLVHIHLSKKIFMAAGLAGGSADAAAVFRGLNQLWQLGVPAERLERLSARLGSDIPFCIRGGTSLATGRGEILTDLPDLPVLNLVLAKPKLAVPTPWVYREYDKQKNIVHPDINALVEAVKTQNLAEMLRRCGNVLEAVTVHKYPVLEQIKQIMLENGALLALMSGSGPTVFGLTADQNTAEKIKGALGELDLELAVAVTTGRRI